MVFVAPIMQTPSNLSHFRKYPQHISVLKHFISDFGQTSPKAYFFTFWHMSVLFFFFFCMWTTFKVFIEFVKYCFYLCFVFFGHEVCRILAPWPEIEPTLLSLEGSLNQWTSREVLGTHLNKADRIFSTFSFPGPITTLKWVSLVPEADQDVWTMLQQGVKLPCSPMKDKLLTLYYLPCWLEVEISYFPGEKLYTNTRYYGFSSGHVWMWELDYKESLMQKNWCF